MIAGKKKRNNSFCPRINSGAKRILTGIVLSTVFSLFADDLQLDTKVPLGLAHDGQILWIGDAQTRELTGYDVGQKKKLATRTLAYDMRDLAYWAPNIVTVAPNYIFVINPINGDLVDKIPLKGIADPVAIALDMHQAYIYNRADKKIHRVHMVDRLQFGSFTPEITADVRSLTFYKGFLWAIAKDGKAYKISPSDGSQISFLPLPESSFGITFVDGGMYVARPGQVRSVDFIETENYVAAAKRSFTIAGELELTLPWSEEVRKRESRLQLKYALLPITAHQRIAGLRADPFTRFGRWEDGSHTSEISLPQASTERSRTHQLQFQVTIYNLTHIFNAQLVKLYFKNPELPDGIRVYLDSLPLAAGDEASVEGFRKDWLAKNDGKHPIYAIAAVMKDQQFKTDTRCAIFRSLGIPARRMKFVDLDSRKTSEFVQVYLQPTGWVTITSRYDAAKPREFPVANNELELYSPDDLQVLPRLASSKSGAVAAMPELMKFQKIQIITSSSE
jgi:hypothetical protein